MQRRASKRKQQFRLMVIYTLMTTSVVAIAAVLMLITLGYSFNRADGRLEQGGLLKFESLPSGASVTFDNDLLSQRTPSQTNVDTKNHNARMDLKGYRMWQKTIAVRGGTVGWLSYARLIPNEITPESVRTFPKLAASLASPNRRWIAALEDASQPTITLINIEAASPLVTTLALPAAVLTPSTGAVSYTLNSWGSDDRYILVKRIYDGDKSEWLVVDRQAPEKTINLTTTFAIAASKVVFGARGGRDLYVQTDDIVRKVNLDEQTLSRPLVANVESFTLYHGSTVLYVTKPDAAAGGQRHLGYVADGMEKAQTISSYPGDTPTLHIAFGDYYSRHYVAISHGTTLDLYSGTLPKQGTPANLRPEMSTTITADTTAISISRNGRFVIAEAPGGYTTYDIELKKTDTATYKRPVTTPNELHWLDDYMIWHNGGGMLRFYEFDGANQQDIMPVAELQAVSLTPNDTYVYGFHQAPNGMTLIRGKLILR